MGDDPKSNDDFKIVLAPLFEQIGLGEFCWDKLSVANGTAGVKDGAKATIQVRQYGPDDGWLYNVCYRFLPPHFESKMRDWLIEGVVCGYHIYSEPTSVDVEMRK